MRFNYQYALPNLAYGTRIFRRRIRLEKRGKFIIAGLEDIIHALKITVEFDGDVIKDIQGVFHRHPNASCAGATQQFAPFIGTRATAHRATFRDYSDPRQQCTHFHDTLGLVMSHALRDEAVRQYDVTIPDMVGESTPAEVRVNGTLMHHWDINRKVIVAPEHLKGNTLTKGFTAWATALYSGDELEAAYVLQMATYVSWAGEMDFEAMAVKYPGQILVPPVLAGACYAMQERNIQKAFPSHNICDYTNNPEKMLAFL